MEVDNMDLFFENKEKVMRDYDSMFSKLSIVAKLYETVLVSDSPQFTPLNNFKNT
jgi:hypothetical protein